MKFETILEAYSLAKYHQTLWKTRRDNRYTQAQVLRSSRQVAAFGSRLLKMNRKNAIALEKALWERSELMKLAADEHKQRLAVEAEIERLRAALRQVIHVPSNNPHLPTSQRIETMVEIASEALGLEPEDR